MTTWMEQHIGEHVDAGAQVVGLLPAVGDVVDAIRRSYESRGIVYTLGNGGSAADAQHFAGELIGHFKRDRRPLGAVSLGTDPSVMTCIANDYSYDDVFARQVAGLVRPGDVVAGFTTSGESPNVVGALETARRLGAVTVLFGGAHGGTAVQHADHVLLAPSEFTPRIQEVHTLLLHLISEALDRWAIDAEDSA